MKCLAPNYWVTLQWGHCNLCNISLSLPSIGQWNNDCLDSHHNALSASQTAKYFVLVFGAFGCVCGAATWSTNRFSISRVQDQGDIYISMTGYASEDYSYHCKFKDSEVFFSYVMVIVLKSKGWESWPLGHHYPLSSPPHPSPSPSPHFMPFITLQHPSGWWRCGW